MARHFENELSSSIDFKPFYKTQDEDDDLDDDLNEGPNMEFDFELVYSLPPDQGNPEVRTAHVTIEFDLEWLNDWDEGELLEKMYHFLDLIDIPCYRNIVETMHQHFLDLKKSEADPLSPKVERVEVRIQVTVTNFPKDDDEDVDQQLAVPPASDEA